MRKRIISLLLIASLLLSCMALAACKKSADDEEQSASVDIDELAEDIEGEDDYEDPNPDDPAYDNELDGAEPVMTAHDEKDFYGKWSATSERAHYVFGNVDLVISDDGSWSGNIVEEEYTGTWEYKDSSLNIKSSDNLINWNLFFVEDGSLMFKDLDDPDLAPLVLKAQ